MYKIFEILFLCVVGIIGFTIGFMSMSYLPGKVTLPAIGLWLVYILYKQIKEFKEVGIKHG